MGWGKAGLENNIYIYIYILKKIIVNWQCMGWAWGGGRCGYYVLEKLYLIGCIGMGWGGAGLGIIIITDKAS